MMSGSDFDVQKYLAEGGESIIRDAMKATLKNPKESLYLLRFSRHVRKATRIRQEYSKKGKNIPAFLIASITSSCNLHCTGCYSRANESCSDEAPSNQLTGDEWADIFIQARDMGISFIVLAGGEPLLRRDVIERACEFPEILFPIFTNGTMIDGQYFKMLDDNRNLVPILSIEGDKKLTDSRRGEGVYDALVGSMERMRNDNIVFGASLTFTRDNLETLTSRKFIEELHDYGCRVVFFIEYVPVNRQTIDLAPGDSERDLLLSEIGCLRREYDDMLFLSFPGDEKSSGGCLAAGRGFFHINSHGGAEPCPASPYSDINVRDAPLIEVLDSKLFKSLREGGILMDSHEGGCVLFEHEDDVRRILE